MDEEEVLDWLTDPDNMESSEHIERVNRKMFERILKRSDFVAAFFCKIRKYFLKKDGPYLMNDYLLQIVT